MAAGNGEVPAVGSEEAATLRSVLSPVADCGVSADISLLEDLSVKLIVNDFCPQNGHAVGVVDPLFS